MDQQIAPMEIGHKKARAYWKANLKIVGILLAIWFLCSYGAGILFKDWLNQFTLGGFKLGFWFAQQGAIYIFVLLIFVYILLMNRLDTRYGFNPPESESHTPGS